MDSHCSVNPNYHFECPVHTGFMGTGIGLMMFGTIVGIDGYRHQRQEQPQSQLQQQSSISIADELMKLAGLKERGIISEEEFAQMKQDLIKKKI